jgi:hypothetical protein
MEGRWQEVDSAVGHPEMGGSGPDAVVAIALTEGHSFSAATLARHQRG